jgi:putative transcriptional regulator
MKKYKSSASEAIHSIAADLHTIGVIDEKELHGFTQRCLATPPRLEPQQIRGLRSKTGVSQVEFARLLNVTESTVSKWERGEKRPSGPTLRLLQIVAVKGVEILYV